MGFSIAFYKGTPKGYKGWYNRLVRWWTKSPYSHCELVFSDGLCASSSFMDGGVRFKRINLTPDNWDVYPLPQQLEENAQIWFIDHHEEKYDVRGNLHIVIPPVDHDKNKWSCSEACTAALGITGAEGFYPGILFHVTFLLTKMLASDIIKKPLIQEDYFYYKGYDMTDEVKDPVVVEPVPPVDVPTTQDSGHGDMPPPDET